MLIIHWLVNKCLYFCQKCISVAWALSIWWGHLEVSSQNVSRVDTLTMLYIIFYVNVSAYNRFLLSLHPIFLQPIFHLAPTNHTDRFIMISIWFIIYKRNNHCHNYFILECIVICLWFDSNCGERHELISARYANTIIMFHMIYFFRLYWSNQPFHIHATQTPNKKKIKTTANRTTIREKNKII